MSLIKQKLFYSILLLMFAMVGLAQEQTVDSLKSVLESDLSEKERVDTYNELADFYRNVDFSQIEQYTDPAIVIAQEIEYWEGLAEAYYLKGGAFIWRGEFDTTLILLEKAVEAATRADYLAGLGKAYNGQGYVAWKKGKLDDALDYYAKALEAREKSGDLKGVADTYLNIGNIHSDRGDLDATLVAVTKCLDIRREIGDQLGEAFALGNMAEVYGSKGEYNRSIELFEESIELNLAINSRYSLANDYSRLGAVYEQMGNYPKAVESLLQSLEINQEIENKEYEALNYTQLGMVYARQGEFDRSLSYFRQALTTNTKLGNKLAMADLYNNIGYIHSEQGTYDSAFNNYEKSLKIAGEIDAPSTLSNLYHSIGSTHQKKGQLSEALEYLSKALQIQEEYEDLNGQIETLLTMGRMSRDRKDYKGAISYVRQADEIARTIGSKGWQRDATALLATLHNEMGNYRLAFGAQQLAHQLSDSISNQQNTRRIARLEAAYEFNKEKDSLTFVQETERIALNAEIQSGKTTQRATLIGLGLTIALLIVLFMFYRQKKQINEQLSKLNVQIQDQNAEIKSQRDHLEDLNHTKNRFFSIISHDLRGPMSSFQSLSEIMDFNLSNNNYDEVRDVTQEVVKQSKQISLLLDNLLNWAVNDEGKIPLEPEQLEVKEVVNSVLEIYKPIAGFKNIELQNGISDEQTIWADRNSFLVILRNLISNALKFTPTGGSIVISAESTTEAWALQIKDSGVGMTEEEHRKLFVLREHSSSSGTEDEKGVGLGLQLVHDFVQMNNGSIAAESEKGKGTTFIVHFPLHKEASMSTA